MGSLRLFLALWVLLSHGGLTLSGFNPGVAAVVVFYLISGQVMAGLLASHFTRPEHMGGFYRDRFLRIYPQYAAYLLLTAAWWWFAGGSTAFLQRPPNATDVFNNLSIVPLNFFMFNGADAVTLLPAAWSLGAELQFYLLAPLLWHRPRWALGLGAISLLVHAGTWPGWWHADWWGYRLLPGVLWVFLLGMALHRLRHRPRLQSALAWVVALAAGLVAAVLGYHQRLLVPYQREVLLGVALGLPLVLVLSRWCPVGRLATVDRALGHCAYGVFLNHFLVLWCLPSGAPQTGWHWLLWVCASVGLSALSYTLIDRPVAAWRQQMRPSPVHGHGAREVKS